ncbi:MAG: hypothetical protein EB120_05660 [Proteobacteria bacterium]|nr:hypothetical protein [Pseudomonadota bacterium]
MFVLNSFDHLLPEVIFEAVEKLGGRCTGRFLALNAMENRVYDVEMEEGPHLIIKFYRPGRWSQQTIQAEHDFLLKVEAAEVPVVVPLKDSSGCTLFKKNDIFYAVFPKRPGRLEPELNHEQLKRLGRFLARIHTVGDSIKNAPRGKLNPQTYGRDRYAMKNRDILIDAYLEIRDFDERTWKLVEPLRALRMIYFNGWIANRKDDGAFKMAFPNFGTEQYWQAQIENLSNQLERIKIQLEKTPDY